jgi:hypothetical protein
LQKAIALHYHNGERPTVKAMHDLALAWRPYRSVATWYLWRSLDPIRSSTESPRVMSAPETSPHPYAALTPDRALDALATVGILGDGRLQALGSYENRVYPRRHRGCRSVVAKFYRAGRWSDAAIAEEHLFVAELAEREIPVVAPLSLAGRTLHTADGFRFAVYRDAAGGRRSSSARRRSNGWADSWAAFTRPAP